MPHRVGLILQCPAAPYLRDAAAAAVGRGAGSAASAAAVIGKGPGAVLLLVVNMLQPLLPLLRKIRLLLVEGPEAAMRRMVRRK